MMTSNEKTGGGEIDRGRTGQRTNSEREKTCGNEIVRGRTGPGGNEIERGRTGRMTKPSEKKRVGTKWTHDELDRIRIPSEKNMWERLSVTLGRRCGLTVHEAA